MSRTGLRTHLGTAFAFAVLSFVVIGGFYAPALASRLGEQRALSAADRALFAIDAALERGEPADHAADRIGATLGMRVVVVARDGDVIGDTRLDGGALGRPLEASLAANLPAVRNRGRLAKRVELESGPAAFAGAERGRGVVLLAVRPLDGAKGAPAWVGLGLAGLFGVALLAVAFAVGLARVLRPARELGDLARAIAAGDFTLRMRSERDDELGELGRAIDGVADELRARMERLATEENLRTAVLDAMVEAVFVTDDGGVIVLTNAALTRLLGRDVRGMTPMEAVRSVELHRAVQDTLSAGPRHAQLELHGGETSRLLQAAVAPTQQGGVVVVLHDVTRLHEIDRIRRDFVANASHELRTPLTAIRGYAETLRGGALDDRATAERFLDVILRHSVRLERLVNDMVSLSRAESADVPSVLTEVDAGAVVTDVIRGLEAEASAKGVRLVAKVADGLPTCRTDAAALDQIAINLVDNAIKYGTGPAVEVRLSATASAVVLEVWNDGPAIPPQHLDRLFERFYRVDAGRSRAVGGTGLGLSIVRHLALRVQASIEVESVAGRGTTFRLTMPRA